MKYLSILFLLLISGIKIVIAQNPVNITGKITDINSKPVIAATTALLSVKDSSLAKVSVSDDGGVFELQSVKPGEYLLKVTAIGFDNYVSDSMKVNGSANIALPVISLSTASVSLNEVTVTAKKPLIEVKADKTVFNVESSVNAAGNTAMELLQKSPGVVVDQNDNIYLKGRGGVQIQIDGKPTQLSGSDLADLLKSIQASEIESIELISNPSSKYEAEGTAGIINIKLKKNKNLGTNGSVTAGYGISTFPKYNTSLSLNHRDKIANVFGTYSNNWGNRLNHFNIYRIQEDTIYDQQSPSIFSGLRNNFKAGADFFISSKHTLGVMMNGNISNYDGNTNSKTNISAESDTVLNKILFANTNTDGKLNNLNFNINYRFADTSGHELNMDADYGRYRNDRNSFQTNQYTSPDESVVLEENDYRTISPTDIDIYALKSDYTQNFLKGKLGAGFKFSWVKTDNTFDFYDVIDGTDQLDSTRSNRFVYTENVNAVYLNYQRTIKSIDLQFGLRTEQTNSDGNLTSVTDEPDQNVERHYLDWFPSGGVTYNLNKKNSFAVSYSRRIDRPNYQELNPFEYKLDELTYRKGNPFLNPQYTDKVELSHTYNYALTTSLSYSHTRDFFAQITDTLSGGRSYITTKNLAEENVLSLDVSGQFPIAKWWDLYASASLYSLHYAADFGEGKVIDATTIAYNFYAQNTFKLPKSFSIEVSGWYSSPSIWGGTYKTAEQGSVDAGVQKKLFKDRGNLKLSISDIFHTSPWSSVNQYGGLYIEASGDWESRQFRATFSYRFGSKQVKGARQRQTGNESEMQRIGSGDQ